MPNEFPPASPFAFGTKGETLARLAPLLGVQHFVDQTLFTVAEWRNSQDRVTAGILAAHGGHPHLVVRSSACGEDGAESSMAGAFTTVVSVRPEAAALAAAVDEVIASYGDGNREHHVLVQPMIEDVVISGVVLTRELDTGSPYYVVNYDDVTGRTDGVTGGHGENKCILVRRAHAEGLRSARFQGLIRLIREIEAIACSDELDIEFCITAGGQIFILQVRPLAAKRNWLPLDAAAVQDAVEQCKAALGRHFQPRPGLFGQTTLFGEMPDWNPAEMIGNSPKPLALSLYCHLITDAAWATARRNMGYRPVPSDPLLVDFAGRPYIDVRLSLNSFLPAGIEPDFAARLVDWQLQRLAENPEWHDKIEFAVAATCRDLGFADYVAKLEAAGFDGAQVRRFGEALGAQTGRCVGEGGERLQALYERTRRLGAAAQQATAGDPRARALALVDECIEGGIVPFAELARHAFIGVAFLKSAVSRGALAAADVDALLKGVNTVAGEFAQDMHFLSQGRLSQAAFLERYGHLRPGTYDITSWRYDEHPDIYLSGHCAEPPAHPPYAYTAAQRRDMECLLAAEGYSFGLDTLTAYITQAVRLREAAKFEFTKTVSEALKMLAHWGEGLGFSREDIAHLTIGQIGRAADRAQLAEWIAAARADYAITRAIRLPHLIAGEIDADVVRMPLGSPNFITGKRITAPVRLLHVNEVPDLEGEIVLIESADPGFDWIFSRQIGGLITKYGGANSHMAIRCAEFDLPAAIGCGERMFDLVAHEHKVELNCAARTIKPVR